MINNKFKKCCENCEFLDMEHNQEDVYNPTNGIPEVYLEIGCIHSYVCSRYLAEGKDE